MNLCVTHVCVGVLRDQKKVLDLLGLGLQVVVCHVWVLDLNPDPLGEHPALFTMELSLQPQS